VTEARASFAVADRDGLHARPCARIARAAQRHKCAVVAEWNGRRADASSVLELLGLSAPGGAVIEFRATGRDAEACLAAIGRALAQAS
jgi:phosphotransferase system HPr (HPr) family protein